MLYSAYSMYMLIRETVTSFEQWMMEVDAHICDMTGLVSADLPDIAYRDMYDDDCTSLEAANEALVEAGY